MFERTDTRAMPDRAGADEHAERLVVDGLRYWLAGYGSGSIDSWERAWSLYAGELARARVVVSGLSCYARALNGFAKCGFEMLASGCPRRCAHECLAVALVAAWQRGRREEAAGIADELVVAQGLPSTLEAAANFSDVLRRAELLLPHALDGGRLRCGLARHVPASATRH
jgi:hypothetical protein